MGQSIEDVIVKNYPEIIQTSSDFKIVFQRGQDSATFWDKGTEVHSLSQDKGTVCSKPLGGQFSSYL